MRVSRLRRRLVALAFFASVGVVSSVSLAGDVPISEEARMHFKAGVAHLQDPEGTNVEEAYREFKAAYALSSSPKMLGNIGFCAMKLERDGEAIAAYGRYLKEVGDIDPEERAQIERDIQTLTTGVARVVFDVDVMDARIIDVRVPTRGDRVTNTYGPIHGRLEIGERPGDHQVTVKADGFEDATWEFEARAGHGEAHSFAMKKREAPLIVGPAALPMRESPSVLPVVVMGVGGAMLVTGAVTGLVALSKTSTISKACPNDMCPNTFDLASNRDTARTFVRLTDILLIGGAVVGGVGLTWWMLARKPSEEAAPASAPKASAMCTGQGCIGTLRLAF